MNKIVSTLLFTSLGTFLSGGVVTFTMMVNHQPLSAATLQLLSITSDDIGKLGFNLKKNDKNNKGANDCPGFFVPKDSSGFDSCDIGAPFNREISKIIAKFEYDKDGNQGKVETNTSDFETITKEIAGEKFQITLNDGSSGTWSYDRGEGDPGVRFWVAKGGNEGFELFWKVDKSFTEKNGICDMNDNEKKFSIQCLRLAEAVTSGNWNTPNGQGLSHLSFYNGEREVPEPSLILGFLSLGLMTFSKRFSKSKNTEK